MVSLLFYQPLKGGIGERLRARLEVVFSKDRIETYHTVGDLYAHLQKSMFQIRVAVIFAATKKDFEEILGLKDFLSEIRLILVLPDDSPELIAEAHQLRPRFMTWVDSDNDFQDIESVLKRLMVLSKDRFREDFESAAC